MTRILLLYVLPRLLLALAAKPVLALMWTWADSHPPGLVIGVGVLGILLGAVIPVALLPWLMRRGQQ